MAVEPLFFEDGFLNIFKPPGMTSHDVVGYLRRSLKPRKVGHGGTLDPVACGVLVCLINKATRLSPRVSSLPKKYRAVMLFGLKTDTGDVEGNIIEKGTPLILHTDIESILEKFMGEIEQIPPMMSAIKVDGRPLYKLARKGVEIERKPRTVNIHGLSAVKIWEDGGRTAALLDISCSGGTYVRTLVEDIGAALGTVATTAFLIRTAVGPFTVEGSLDPAIISVDNAAGKLIAPDYIDGIE